MRLKGKVAIVTGGAQGIGKVYALRLAAEGAKVAVTDILDTGPVALEIAEQGGEALALRNDVADPESAEAMARDTVERFGRIDALVNNAALFAPIPTRPFEEIPLDEWDQVMSVNVKGLFLCSRAVAPYMKAQGSGGIINISSTTTLKGVPGLLHYVSSKGAVTAFTRALARELGDFGIRVNTIAPSYTLSEGVLAKGQQNLWVAATRAIKRESYPEDMAGTLVFLVSDDSAFVTGQMIVVDGGSFMH